MLAEQFRCGLFANRRVADAFDAQIGIDPQHPIAAAIAVHVEPGVLAGQLVAAAGQVEADHAGDPGIFRHVGCAQRSGETGGDGRGEKVAAVHVGLAHE